MRIISLDQTLKGIQQFDFKGTVTGCIPYGNGHINDTFLIVTRLEDGTQVRYILQALNTDVFKEPDKVLENIDKVTSFLRKKNDNPRGVMELIHTKDGKTSYVDNRGYYWRAFTFIEDSLCLEHPENTSDFYECAVAFGQFQYYLNEFPAETLHETIPDFHNTPKRFKDFLAAVENDVAGRAASVQKEIEFYKAREDFYSVLMDSNKAGILPLRVTHNDTKSNNVMLDAKTRKALCVIDLDTIMPGFSVTDFGDSIRFGASTAAEDEKDLSKVNIDLEMFDVYADGFLTGCGGLLSNDEIRLMPEGAKMMTVECGMRFLTDYLNGDTYFKTAYDTHNLDRCHTQMKLVEDMEAHWDEMKQIIEKYTHE